MGCFRHYQATQNRLQPTISPLAIQSMTACNTAWELPNTLPDIEPPSESVSECGRCRPRPTCLAANTSPINPASSFSLLRYALHRLCILSPSVTSRLWTDYVIQFNGAVDFDASLDYNYYRIVGISL